MATLIAELIACRVCAEPVVEAEHTACEPCLSAVNGLRGSLREAHLVYLASCRDRIAARMVDGARKIAKLSADDERRPEAEARYRGLSERLGHLLLVVPEKDG